MTSYNYYGSRIHPSIAIPILVAIALVIFAITRHNKQAEANKQPQEQPIEAFNE